MSKIIYNDRAYGEIIGGGGAGGLGGGIELTQAEYDALDQSEKDKDIIYFITDGNPEGMVVNDSVPIGSIQAYAGANPPGNWLICAGQAVSRTKYQKLFNVIGTTYGEGDGSTTFNLPDLRGKVAIGQSPTYELGASGGEVTHTLNINEMPSHMHQGIYWINPEQPAWNVTLNDGTYGYKFTWTGAGGSATTGAGANEKNLKTGLTGGGEAHNNMQPYLVTNYIIKALDSSIIETEKLNFLDLFYPVGSYYETQNSTFDPNIAWGGTWELEEEGLVHIGAGSTFNLGDTGGEKIHTLTIDEMPSHIHDRITFVNNSGWTVGDNSGIGNTQVDAHTITFTGGYSSSTSSAVSHWNTSSAGSNQAHNNMQPYKVVNRWLRTA